MKVCLLKILLIKYIEIILISRKLMYTFVKNKREMSKIEFSFYFEIAALRHSNHRVCFSLPLWFSFYIGFLTQFFPGLIISSSIQNRGLKISCLVKNVYALTAYTVIIGLAERKEQTLKTVMTGIANRYS